MNPLLKGKPLREEIVFLKNRKPEEFGRFIMALKALQESDDWYRICGIHGNTFRPNDPCVLCPTDIDIVEKINQTGEPGYCKHSVFSFIAWHTPYIYQFELLLNKYSIDYIKPETKHDEPSQPSYITLPYLDLTLLSNDYTFINEATITILYCGEWITVNNPLATAFFYENGVKTPIRRNGFLSPITNKEWKQLKSIQKQIEYALQEKTYEWFSSRPVNKGTKSIQNGLVYYVPLESPHNSLHNIIGGTNGNMSDISISAFDPLFWLHHCNMDRIYYNWLYNATKGFVSPFTMKQITQDTCLKTLAPFFKDGIYYSDPEQYSYGWLNKSNEFPLLKDSLHHNLLPYTYNKINILKRRHQLVSYIEIQNIPIPPESMTVNAYIYPVGLDFSNFTKEQKDDYYAGSADWVGINREEKTCTRCNVTRTTLIINVEDFVLENESEIKEYDFSIEGEGKMILINGKPIIYSQSEIVCDGSIQIYLNKSISNTLWDKFVWSFK